MATIDQATTQTYEFTLVYSGPTELTQVLEDAIFEAGCGDATLGMVAGQMVLDFCRESISFEEALTSAISDVRRAGLACSLIRVELVRIPIVRAGTTRTSASDGPTPAVVGP